MAVLEAASRLIYQAVRACLRAHKRKTDNARAENWLVVQGKVASVYRGADDGWDTYYAYAANGSYYSGSFWTSSFPIEIRKKGIVIVRYNPQNPELSVVLDSDQTQ